MIHIAHRRKNDNALKVLHYSALPGVIVEFLVVSPLIATLKPQSNRPSFSNTVIDTLAVNGLAVTFATARRELGGRVAARRGPFSLYQM